MANTFPLSPRLQKGALVEFREGVIGPKPNVIVFQYNPESITRSLEVWQQNSGGESSASNNASITAQPFDPPESFTLSLELDAADDLEDPDSNPVALNSGVAHRIAAMEMLLYPQADSLAGDLLGSVTGSLGGGANMGAASGISSAISATIGGASPTASRGTVPVVLFVWGPGRIVPVRLTSFSVEEQAYSPRLYPIRAKISIGLKILTPKDFPSCHRKLSEDLAITAFRFTRKQKEKLAAISTANSIDSILGMLPF